MDFSLSGTSFDHLSLEEGQEHIVFCNLQKQEITSDISDEDCVQDEDSVQKNRSKLTKFQKMDFEIKLIEEIKKYKCLYNSKHLNYTNQTIRNDAWENISTKFNISSDVCQKRWRSIRDSLRYNIKLKTKTKWPHFYRLKFLLPHLKLRNSSDNLPLTLKNNLVDEEMVSENESENNESKCFKSYTTKLSRIDFEIKLIEEVKNYEIIYNIYHDKFRNLKMRNAVWERISTNLNVSSDICRTRWRTIRDMFNSVNKNNRKSNWLHLNRLNFLYPYLKTETIMINLNENENIENCENDEEILEEEEIEEPILLCDVETPKKEIRSDSSDEDNDDQLIQNKSIPNDDFEMQLIEEVKKYECIYNIFHEKYKCVSTRNKAWNNISQTLNISDIYCKKKWENLTDLLMLNKKNKTKSKDVKWTYYEQLKFLIPYLKSKKLSDSLPLTMKNNMIDEEMVSENESETNKSKCLTYYTTKLTRTDFEIKLIEEIKKYEYLYNLKHKNFTNPTKRNDAWENISKKFNIPSNVCQKRWRSIRDSLRYNIKLKAKSKWPHLHRLKFILPHLKSTNSSYSLPLTLKNNSIDQEMVSENESENNKSKCFKSYTTKLSRIDFEIKLIEEIKKNENLYNSKHKNFKNQTKRNDAWENIATILNVPSGVCHKRWLCIRDSLRYNNKLKKSKWPHLHRLQFLLPYLRSKKSMTKFNANKNIENLENDEDIQSCMKKLLDQNGETEYIKCDNSTTKKEIIDENSTELDENKFSDTQDKLENITYLENKENLKKCGEIFLSESTNFLIIYCNICNDKFSEITTFNDHIFNIHFVSDDKNETAEENLIQSSTVASEIELEQNDESSTHLVKMPTKKRHSKTRNKRKKKTSLSHDETFFKTATHTCNVCKLEFYSPKSLDLHMYRNHPDEYTGHLYKCSYCMKEYFHKETYNRHIRFHTGERPFECKICDKTYISRASLRSHNNNIHSDKKTTFSCRKNGCNAIFKAWITRIRHERMHEGIKPFQCDQCGICYTSYITLRLHKQYGHSPVQDRPNKCEICGHGFVGKRALQYHMNTHTGEKPYACTECDKTFAKPGGVQQHKKKYHS